MITLPLVINYALLGWAKKLMSSKCWWGQCVLVMRVIFSICGNESQPHIVEKLAALLIGSIVKQIKRFTVKPGQVSINLKTKCASPCHFIHNYFAYEASAYCKYTNADIKLKLCYCTNTRNTMPHGKCFVQYLYNSFCIGNLTHLLPSHINNSCVNIERIHFLWSIPQF